MSASLNPLVVHVCDPFPSLQSKMKSNLLAQCSPANSWMAPTPDPCAKAFDRSVVPGPYSHRYRTILSKEPNVHGWVPKGQKRWLTSRLLHCLALFSHLFSTYICQLLTNSCCRWLHPLRGPIRQRALSKFPWQFAIYLQFHLAKPD